MKKMRKHAKTALCIALSMTLMFTNTGMTVFAEESVQAEEMQRESGVAKTEEDSTDKISVEEEITEEAPVREETEEQIFEETESGTEDSERTLSDKGSEDKDIEEERIKEKDASENELKLTFSGTDIAHGEYKEDGNNITWVIDANGKLTVEGTGDYASNTVGETRSPWSVKRNDILSAEIKVTGMTSADYMFWGCSYLKEVNVSEFDTSSVILMRNMFEGCSSLESVDLSSFNTSNVTHMAEMFRNCNSLTSLDISSFNTGNVIEMQGMFNGCSSLRNIDLSDFDTGNVDLMNLMFSGCSSLTSLDLLNFNTGSVVNMRGMFSGCSSLTSLDLGKFNTSSVSYMDSMFSGCSSLESLDLSSFDTSNVLNMSSMFANCSGLQNLDLNSFDTSNVTNMSSMFSGCSSLTGVDLGNFDTGNVTNMSSMFSSCNGLVNLEVDNFDTGNVTKMDAMFNGCSSLTRIDLSGFDMDKVVDGNDYLSECAALSNIYTPYNLTLSISLPNGGDWYDDAGRNYDSLPPNLSYSISLIKGDSPETTKGYLAATKKKIIYGLGERIKDDDLTVIYCTSDGNKTELSAEDYTTNIAEIDSSKQGIQVLTIQYNGLTASIKISVSENIHGEYKENGNDIVWEIDSDGKLTVEGTGDFSSQGGNGTVRVPWYRYRNKIHSAVVNVQGMTNAASMFSGCSNLTTVDFKDFDMGNITDMDFMFSGCSSLESLNLNSCDVSKVIDVMGMFDGCSSLKSLDIGNLGVNHISSMESMFRNCSSLESLDLGNFNTVGVEGMTEVFKRCSSLESLDLSSFDTSDVIGMSSMFSGCSSLTELDLGDFDTSQVENMSEMFSGCANLTSLNLSSFDTGKVAGMSDMFSGCASLKSLDLSSFDTSKASNMMSMFKDCSSLESLDLGNFDTANVANMDSMFSGCSSLESLDLGNFDTANVTNMASMFSGCSSLANLDLGGFNTTKVTSMQNMLDNCSNLSSIYTICNLKISVSLPTGAWYDASGIVYTELPKEYSNSLLLEKRADTESSTTEESSTEDKDDSPYEDNERTDLESIGTIANIKAKVYDQNAYEPVVKVTVTQEKKKVTLTEGVDYRVLYQNNVNAGTGTVVVRGNGIYKGEITKTFTISQKPIKKLKVVTGGIIGAGSLQNLPVYVYDGTKLLQSGKDYTLADYQTVRANSAQVTVKAVESGNYTGSVVAKLTVYEEGTKLITPEHVKLAEEAVPYTGKAVKPDLTVTVDDTILTNKDYKVQYQNNKNVGTAFVIVTGKGAYKGKVVLPFTIKAETIDKPTDFAIKEIRAATYNGKLQRPSVSVNFQKNGKVKKLSGKDYTVAYKNNLHAGEATVTITGKGNYAGLSATAKFTINPQQIKKASLKGAQGSFILIYSKRTLKEGTDYEKPEYGAVNKNKVPVTIKGKGDFTGTMTKTVKVQ